MAIALLFLPIFAVHSSNARWIGQATSNASSIGSIIGHACVRVDRRAVFRARACRSSSSVASLSSLSTRIVTSSSQTWSRASL